MYVYYLLQAALSAINKKIHLMSYTNSGASNLCCPSVETLESLPRCIHKVPSEYVSAGWLEYSLSTLNRRCTLSDFAGHI